MPTELDDLVFRDSVFAWLRARMLTTEAFSRDDLSHFEFAGRRHRLVGTQTGIWRVKDHSPAAISILTAHAPDERLPDYVVHVKDSVLATSDGPTLQHAIKEMNGEGLRQLPRSRAERPDRDLLAARFETFHQAS